MLRLKDNFRKSENGFFEKETTIGMKNVAIWVQQNCWWLLIPIAEELKRRHGARIHLICLTEQDREYWKRQDKNNAIDTFTTTNHFFFEYDKCAEPYEKVCAEARYYEDKYETLLVDALQADRHLGRGFFAGGTGHPRSELSNKATYIKSADIFNKIIKFWEEYFEKTKPGLIVGAPSGIIGKSYAVVARRNGIPIRVLGPSGYLSYFCWAEDEYFTCSQIMKNFESIGDKVKEYVDDKELAALKRNVLGARDYREWSSFGSKIGLAKESIKLLKKHAYRKCKRITKMGNYKLSENLKYLYRTHCDIRAINKLKTIDIKSLSGRSYILYPLQEEPESALGVYSPEFNEQLAVIEMMAKNLPAGTKLIVKEHLVSVGRRPKDFYSTILDIPNVEMVSPYEYAPDIARTARCVATITSSVGTEAAILGVPIITFGIHNNFNFLHHVHLVESWKELRPLLHTLCKDSLPEDKKSREEGGKRYLAALKVSSVDVQWGYDDTKKNEETLRREVKAAYSLLTESLGLNKQ
jgi:hypothetical protein